MQQLNCNVAWQLTVLILVQYTLAIQPQYCVPEECCRQLKIVCPYHGCKCKDCFGIHLFTPAVITFPSGLLPTVGTLQARDVRPEHNTVRMHYRVGLPTKNAC